MVHFQDSILEHLHHHTLSKMLFDEIFEKLIMPKFYHVSTLGRVFGL
jgi:hypothetical protein